MEDKVIFFISYSFLHQSDILCLNSSSNSSTEVMVSLLVVISILQYGLEVTYQ